MKKSYSKIGNFEISGRFTIPAGVITTTPQTMLRFAKDCEALGIITSKSIGKEPRAGNKTPIVFQDYDGSIIDAVGLANPGIVEAAAELRELREEWPEKKFLLSSIFGKDKEELVYVAKKIAPYSDGLEINVSCPHSSGLAQIGQNPELVSQFTRAVVDTVDIPVIVKLTPSAPDIAAVAEAAEKAGASSITAINTLGKVFAPELYVREGSISGPSIKRLGIRCVQNIAQAVDLPIIGVGGISSIDDILAYRDAGAVFFGIGSRLIGMSTEESISFLEILHDSVYRNKNSLLKEGGYLFKPPKEVMIENIETITRDLKILRLAYYTKDIKPGQFMMLHPGGGEAKPFSAADNHPLMIAVRTVGDSTSRINNLNSGDRIKVSGPYGKVIDVGSLSGSRVCLVGGGTGIAPLNFIAKYLSSMNINPTTFIGAKNKNELMFLDSLKEYSRGIYISTDDGSLGKRGFVTENLENYLSEKDIFGVNFINCGPEAMISKAVQIEKDHVKHANILCGVERYTKCGVGLCGSCEINGYRACVDGPFFEIREIDGALGVYKRDATGKRINA